MSIIKETYEVYHNYKINLSNPISFSLLSSWTSLQSQMLHQQWSWSILRTAKKFVVCDVGQCWHTGTPTTRSPTLNSRTDSRTQGISVKFFCRSLEIYQIAMRCTVSHSWDKDSLVNFISFGQSTHNCCHFQNNILHQKCRQLTIVNEIT